MRWNLLDSTSIGSTSITTDCLKWHTLPTSPPAVTAHFSISLVHFLGTDLRKHVPAAEGETRISRVTPALGAAAIGQLPSAGQQGNGGLGCCGCLGNAC